MRFKALKEWAEAVGLRKSQPEAEGPEEGPEKRVAREVTGPSTPTRAPM